MTHPLWRRVTELLDLIKDLRRRIVVAVVLIQFVEPRLFKAHRWGPRVSVDVYPDQIDLIDVGRVYALCKAAACKCIRSEVCGVYVP